MKSTNPSIARSSAMAISGLMGTTDQVDVLARSGVFDAVRKAMEPCTIRERGLLLIKKDHLDEASLLLFTASRLLNSNSTIPPEATALIDLLNQFNLQKIVSIGKTLDLDTADFSAAMWCIVALNSLQHIFPTAPSAGQLASGFIAMVGIPDKFEVPVSGRYHKDLWSSTIQLASSTPRENPALFAWAVEAMFVCWRSTWLPVSMTQVPNSVISRAAATTIPGTGEVQESVLTTVVGKLNIQSSELVSSGVIGPLLDVVKINDPLITIPAIWILEKFDLPSLSTTGALQALLDTIKLNDPYMTISAICLLERYEPATLISHISTGALQAFSEVIKSHEKRNKFVKLKAMNFIKQMCSWSSIGARAIVEAGLVDLIVKALDSRESEVALDSRESEVALDSPESEVALDSRESEVAHLAEAVLLKTLTSSLVLDDIEAAGIITGFVEALQSDSPPSKAIIRALQMISSHEKGAKAVVDAGAIVPLIAGIQSTESAVAMRAMSAINDISGYLVGASAVVDAGAVHTFATLATTDDIDLALLAIQTLMTISSHDIALTALFDTHTIRSLVEAATRSLAVDNISPREWAMTQQLQPDTSDTPDRASPAIDILKRILQHDQGVVAAIEAGVVDELVEATSSQDLRLSKSAGDILNLISKHTLGVRAVIDAGIIDTILGGITSLDNLVKSSALMILGYLVRDENGAGAVVDPESGILAALKDILHSDEHCDQVDAFNVFGLILDHDKCVEAVFSAGVVAQLVKLAKMWQDYVMLSKLCAGVLRVGTVLEGQILKFVVESLQFGALQPRPEGDNIVPVLKIILAISESRIEELDLGTHTPIAIPAEVFAFFEGLSQSNDEEICRLAADLLDGKVRSEMNDSG